MALNNEVSWTNEYFIKNEVEKCKYLSCQNSKKADTLLFPGNPVQKIHRICKYLWKTTFPIAFKYLQRFFKYLRVFIKLNDKILLLHIIWLIYTFVHLWETIHDKGKMWWKYLLQTFRENTLLMVLIFAVDKYYSITLWSRIDTHHLFFWNKKSPSLHIV